jgi:hypothetical protein
MILLLIIAVVVIAVLSIASSARKSARANREIALHLRRQSKLDDMTEPERVEFRKQEATDDAQVKIICAVVLGLILLAIYFLSTMH